MLSIAATLPTTYYMYVVILEKLYYLGYISREDVNLGPAYKWRKERATETQKRPLYSPNNRVLHTLFPGFGSFSGGQSAFRMQE